MSSFTAQEIETLLASIRPLGLPMDVAKTAVRAHPDNRLTSSK